MYIRFNFVSCRLNSAAFFMPGWVGDSGMCGYVGSVGGGVVRSKRVGLNGCNIVYWQCRTSSYKSSRKYH